MFQIRVFFLAAGLAAGAFGQTSIYPASLKLAAPVGSTTPVSGRVALATSSSFGQYVSFDLTVQYTGSAQGWLSVTPLNGTTPATIVVTADPTNLAIGTYTAQILATVGPLHTGASAVISFIVAPTGSNPAGAAVTPSSLTFRGQSPSSQTFTVVTPPGRTGSIGFTVFAAPADWLTVTPSGQGTPATVTVQPLTSGLAVGTYTGAVVVTDSAGNSTLLPVTLYLPDTGTTQGPVLTPAQKALTFNYQLNSGVNPQQTVIVTTNSTQYVNYTATANASWIGVANASYLTPGSSTLAFAPGLLFVTVDPTNLGAGTYTSSISLSASGLTTVNIPVTLTVSITPVLNSNPSFLSLDANTSLLTSNLAVTASTAFYFTATVSSPWLSVSPNTAVASGNPANLTVTANVSGLPTGTFQGTITLTGTGGSPTMTVPVQLQTATASTTQVSLLPSPASLAFATVSGTNTLPQFVEIGSVGASNLPFTVAALSDAAWLYVDQQSATTPTMIKVTANSALPGGLYTGSLVFTLLQTGDQTTVPVTYTVTGRTLTANPQMLSFVQQTVGAALAPQQVQVTANAPSSFTIAAKPKWATVTPSTGLSTPVNLTVSVDPAGMAPGTYQDAIQLNGPNSLQVPVSLTIAAPVPPTVTPTSLSFSYQLGSPPPASQSIQITASRTTAFTAAASTVSGTNWLVIDTAAGSTPATVTVSIATAQLVPGQQSGAVTFTMQDIAGTTIAVPVTLMVTGSQVRVQSVLNAATIAPTSLAPGEIVTLMGAGLGPATAVTARPSAAGAYGTVLAGTSVLFDESPAPLLMVQDGQINAIVPYSVYGRVSTKVQVLSGSSYSVPIEIKVVDAAPGIFTSAGTGSAQASALNADYTPNSVMNPAPLGGVIVLYMTGEGQTDPPGQDGRIILTDLRLPLLPVTATIGGQPAEVLYAGSAPNMVSGLCQVNLRIPQAIGPGTQPVQILVGGIPSQRGVTVEVR